MLRRLSGRSHVVLTAVAVARDGAIVSDVESVDVTFRELSAEDIARYIATREPMDKAGAYGIQGFGATIVDAHRRRLLRRDGSGVRPAWCDSWRSVGVDYRFGAAHRDAARRRVSLLPDARPSPCTSRTVMRGMRSSRVSIESG